MVWNMDESFVNLSKRAGNRRVLASMGSKNAYRPGSTYSKHITIIACVNNYGEYIPPVLLMKGVMYPVEFLVDAPPGTMLGMTPKGWTNDQVFKEWMQFFISRTRCYTGPHTLLVDGHGSHYSLDALEAAAANNISSGFRKWCAERTWAL